MDEPTANLDVLTEQRVLGTLFTLMRDRTALLITHRLVGLEQVDRILYLDGGRIRERGTHTELVRAGGPYQAMWRVQQRLLNPDPTLPGSSGTLQNSYA
jgi:ATP-binding cassette subfamily C protein CydC